MKKLITIVFGVLFFQHAAFAQPIKGDALRAKVEKPDSLSLHQAIQIAIANNYEIKSEFAKLSIEEANLIIAKYRPNPFLSSFNEFVSKGSLQPVRVGSTIELGKKRHWRIEEAKELVGKKALEIEKKVWDIHTKVHQAYVKLAISQEKYNLINEELNFYNSLDKESKIVTNKVSKLKDDLETLEWELNIAQIELNDLLGKDPYEKTEAYPLSSIQPNVNILESEKFLNLIKQAPEQRLEVQVLEKEHKAVEAKLMRLKWEKIPNITIEAAPVNTQSMIGAFFGSRLPLPIFNRGQGERTKEEARLKYIDQELERIKHKIKIEIASASKKLEPIVKKLKTLKKPVKENFDVNDMPIEKAITREEEYIKSTETYLDIVQKYHITLATLEQAIGVPLYNL